MAPREGLWLRYFASRSAGDETGALRLTARNFTAAHTKKERKGYFCFRIDVTEPKRKCVGSSMNITEPKRRRFISEASSHPTKFEPN